MESTAMTTENLKNTMATVDAMKRANKEIKKQYGQFDVDKIEVRLRCSATHICVVNGSIYRICIMTWKSFLSRRTRFKKPLGRSYAVPDEINEADLEAGAYISSCSAASE